jgi:hypothetical protein
LPKPSTAKRLRCNWKRSSSVREHRLPSPKIQMT